MNQVLVGPSGIKLDQILESAGISRNNCHIMNVIECFPLHKKDKKACKKACHESFLARLKAAVEYTGCKEILAFGDIAVHSLTGNCLPISKWQGYWYPGPFDTRVHAMYHPAFALPSRRPVIMIPMIEAIRHAKIEGPSLPEIPPIISVDALRRSPEVVIDVENDVTGLSREEMDPRKDPLILIGCGTTQGALNVHWPLRSGEEEAWNVIKERCSNPEVTKIGQNFVHDILSMKYKAGIEMKGPCEDLMIAHAAKYPALDHDLGSIHAQYYWNRRWKNYADENFEQYNLLDVHREACLWQNVIAEVKAGYWRCDEVRKEATTLDLAVARQMREIGIQTSETERLRLRDLYSKQKSEAADRFAELCPGVDLGEDGNTGQLRRLFFDKFKVKPVEFSEGGEPSFNSFLLRKCKLESPPHIAHVAAAILAYKKPSKFLSMQLSGKWRDDDFTCHPNIASSWRAINGRWASRKPNLQNVPPQLRSMYVARPGKVFVEIDYAQIELWFQALYSQDTELLDWHDQGVDIHTENAKKLVGWKESDAAQTRKNKRDGMKNCAYGLFYNASEDTSKVLAALWRKEVEITAKELQGLRKIWFGGRPKLAQGQRWLIEQAELNGYSESFRGRRFYFYGGEVDKNQALNLPISSSVGDLMNDSVIKIAPEIDWNETNLLMQVHDSLLFETAPDKTEQLISMCKEIMEQNVTIRGRTIRLKVDAKTGLNWGEMKSA